MSKLTSTPAVAAVCLLAGAALDRAFSVLTEEAPPLDSVSFVSSPTTLQVPLPVELPDLSVTSFSPAETTRMPIVDVEKIQTSKESEKPNLILDPCSAESQTAALKIIEQALVGAVCPDARENLRLAILDLVNNESIMPESIQNARNDARDRFGMYIGQADKIALDAIQHLTPTKVEAVSNQAINGCDTISYRVMNSKDGTPQLQINLKPAFGFQSTYVLPPDVAKQVASIQALSYMIDGEPLESLSVWSQFFDAPPKE